FRRPGDLQSLALFYKGRRYGSLLLLSLSFLQNSRSYGIVWGKYKKGENANVQICKLRNWELGNRKRKRGIQEEKKKMRERVSLRLSAVSGFHSFPLSSHFLFASSFPIPLNP